MAHDTVAVHPLQSNDRSRLELFLSVLCFHVFVFFSCFLFFSFVFVSADFHVSVCVNGFIFLMLTNIFVSVNEITLIAQVIKLEQAHVHMNTLAHTQSK